MKFIATTFLLVVVPAIASTHHSVSALFDRDTTIEVEGEITRVFWRNPHVRLWISDSDGEVWEIETNDVNLLERSRITRDFFAEGDVIRAAGSPARRTEHSLFATNVLFSDGREALVWFGATPRWSANPIDFNERHPIAEAEASTAREHANGIFRVWSPFGGQAWNIPPLTEAAVASRGRWNPLSDDPTLRCMAPGMVEAIVSPYPMEIAEKGGDIIIRMEEWGGTRRVHMSDIRNRENVPTTPMGYSVGHWEDNTLIVSTNRISWPYFDNSGTPQSKDVEMVERFTMTDDEQRMAWEVIITDPVNLTEPAMVRQQYEWVPGVQIQMWNCTLPDEVEPRGTK